MLLETSLNQLARVGYKLMAEDYLQNLRLLGFTSQPHLVRLLLVTEELVVVRIVTM